jgi:hypothetical protein
MDLKPFTSGSLVAAAAFFGFFFTIIDLAGLFGIWAAFVLVPALWHYCHAVLLAAAQGRRTIPTVEINRLNPLGGWRVTAHFIVFWLFLVMMLYVRPFGETGPGAALNWAVVLGAAFVFPASAGALAVASSLEDAVNPKGIAHFIGILGPSYFGLVVPCAAFGLAAALAPTYIFPRMGFLSLILSNVVAVWALLATFVAVGVSIRHHRTAFAIPGEVETAAEYGERLQRREWRDALNRAYGSIRSGLVAEGYKTLHDLSAQHGDSAEILYWLFENMLDWEDRTHALQVGARLIERHVADKNPYAALELLTRCRRLDPKFAVTAPTTFALADFARSIGRQGLADDLGTVRG